jgi:sulfur carrier protein ThiS
MKLILPDQESITLEHDPAPVEQILLEQGINPLEVIVTRKTKMISEDTVVEADDEIRIIWIAHGG